MFDAVSPTLLAWWTCVFVLAGFIHGGVGFGFPFVATPLIAISSDIRTAVVVVLVPTLVTIGINISRSGPLWPVLKRFWAMPLYSLLGSFAGTWLFVAAPRVPYSFLLAVVTLIYLKLDRIAGGNWPTIRRHERPLAPLAGISSGVFEGTVNAGAPPLIVFYLALGLPGAVLVQALNLSFLFSKTTQFVVLATRGGVTVFQWLATLPFAAVGALAFLGGLHIRNRVDAATFRKWVKGALLIIALGLLVQNVLAWIKS